LQQAPSVQSSHNVIPRFLVLKILSRTHVFTSLSITA
jgi:hypothetical protein